MTYAFSFKALALVFTGLATAATAQDGGLYGDVFAPNSSFIRVLAPTQVLAKIGSKSLKDMENGVSQFVNVMPGEVTVAFADTSTMIDVQPNAHYTVVSAAGNDPIVLTDEILASPSKADVSFYNLTSTPDVELFVPLAKATVFTDVAPSTGQTIAIKAPLTLDFEVRSGGETIAMASQVDLLRKSGVSIVLIEEGSGFKTLTMPNSYLK